MPNRLANSSSPYLRQHQDNPVDWYPWGDEALARARAEDKPILVSIGYSSCHWCHVMAHQSFEDVAIAARMNDWFINIKVDREERPDIDAIYMSAVQAMTRQGGWPLNVFLTPEGVPFFGGTYWPPRAQGGMAGFPDVLEAIHRAWTTNRVGVLQSAAQIREYLESAAESTPAPGSVSAVVVEAAMGELEASFDAERGGFGEAPKFPQAPALEFLATHAGRDPGSPALAMLTRTLDAMAAGGIHDQIGGGFARYAVDANWLVPHFEKMLYDNAQLVSLYTRAWGATGSDRYREVVERAIAWAEREMKAPGGGYFAALDADSEGVEGKFYIWSLAELEGILSTDELDFARLHYGITETGNFEGESILFVDRDLDHLAKALDRPLEDVRDLSDEVDRKLLLARSQRIRPGTDSKVIVSWNALMVKALAEAGTAFGRPEWIDLARETVTVLVECGRSPGGRLGRTIVDGKPAGQGVLEDHAALADALLTLHGATADQRWLDLAGDLVDIIQRDFAHSSAIGFFDTAVDHEALIVRPRDLQDGALPSGNAMAIDAMLTVARLQFDDALEQRVHDLLASLAAPMAQHPAAFGRYLAVLDRVLAGETLVVIAGDPASPGGKALRDAALGEGNLLVDLAHEVDAAAAEKWPQLAPRLIPAGATAAAFVCHGTTCLPPVTSARDLTSILRTQPPS
jgi:uncharacterized protein YyaL (SSP411 family)